MKPTPVEEPRRTQRTPKETDAETERPPDKTPKPKPKDDGSVPDKQIGRWKDEGGSWHPAD